MLFEHLDRIVFAGNSVTDQVGLLLMAKAFLEKCGLDCNHKS